MIILMTAALAAAQPAASVTEPAQQMENKGTMEHMGPMEGMSEKQMADCHKCCEEMMAKMHEGNRSTRSQHNRQ